MLDPKHLLDRIHDRLTRGAVPAQVIEEFLPTSRAEAIPCARRLPLWDEFRGQFSPQVVALARLLSRRAMRQFGLLLDADGHVAEEQPRRSARGPTSARHRFTLRLGDEAVQVEYAPHYFPNSDQDLLTFMSPHEPPRPHPLSTTGFWSHFTSHDAVEACGGPEPYAALLAEAMLRGDTGFDAAFHGARPEHVPRPRKPVAAPPPAQPEAADAHPPADDRQASGPHSARVIAAEEEGPALPPAEGKPTQGFLF